MKTKFYLIAAVVTLFFASATLTASAQRGFFPPHRFFPAPVRIGVPLPVPQVAVYGPGYGYAPAYGYGPAPVVVGGGYYRDRVFVDRRGSFGYAHRGFRR